MESWLPSQSSVFEVIDWSDRLNSSHDHANQQPTITGELQSKISECASGIIHVGIVETWVK